MAPRILDPVSQALSERLAALEAQVAALIAQVAALTPKAS